MRFSLTYISLFLMAGAAVAMSGGVILTTFTASTDGGAVVVRWQALPDSEKDVHSYFLERKRDFDHAFEVIGKEFRVNAPGVLYEYRDRDLYKVESNEVVYRLRVQYKGGGSETLNTEIRVDYTSTAVRRTWGSIKAMFQ